MIRFNNRGDTIVEVLLALTIVSSMLGGAYVLSNRSLSNSRGSQERGEALKIAEAQLERLKSSINNGNDDAFNSTNIFCMNESNNVTAATSPTLGLVPALNSAQDDLNIYTTDCKIQKQSLPYYVAFETESSSQFYVHVRWDSLTGPSHNEVTLTYRIYQ
ncbi:MAG TPA: hypothetical protein VJJ78_02200 [Candidatus Saccharimonadales bacterium]|nr:hypothetical protein [Candidatus Saccharimonadales bacterium]